MTAVVIKQHPNSSSMVNFKLVGLGALIKVFKIYGLTLDTAPGSGRINRDILLMILYGLFYGTSCIMSFRYIDSLISDNMLHSNFLIISFVATLGGYQLKTFFCFLHPCIHLDKYRKFLGDLGSTLNRIHALDPGQKVRTQHLTKMLIGMTFLDIIIFALINAVCAEGAMPEIPQIVQNKQLNSILEIGIKTLCSFGYVTICSFTIFYPLFCLLICELLTTCFDFFVPYDETYGTLTEPNFSPHPWSQDTWGRRISLARRQKEHRNLCILVRQANDIFRWFLFISIIEEMALVIVLFLDDAQVDFSGDVIISTFTKYASRLWKIGHFILKTVYFSAVNEKVKTSLMIPSCPDTEAMYNSKEHVQYLLYLKQQTMRPTSITYGGLFPVQLNFIFTLISTAITYMLVIKDIPK